MLTRARIASNAAVPAGLRDLAPLRNPRRMLAWLLVPLLAALAWLAPAALGRIGSLGESRLVGPRSPAPVGLVVALDVSGSFASYAAVRTRVLEEVVRWAPANLRPDDTLTVLTFAGGADVLVDEVTMAELARTGPRLLAAGPAVDGTRIQPLLHTAADHVTPGRTTTLVVVSDTVVSDLDRTAVDRQVRQLDAATMTLIVPEGVRPTRDWASVFDYEQVLASSPEASGEIALAIGRAIAHATGQALQRR